MFIVAVGINHKTAPVEVRERMSFAEHSMPESLAGLRSYPVINGAVILSTCNRTEIYTVNEDAEQGLEDIKEFLSLKSGLDTEVIGNYLYSFFDHDAVKHLYQVAAGLDSMLLGETQILGQVRAAYELSLESGNTGRILNILFQQAIRTGKRARAETGIDQHAVSISYAAVELAKQIFKDLTGRSVLVIGAGKMSELTTKHLVANGVSGVIVSNRSFDRAVTLANQFNGIAVKFNDLFKYMGDADIVISCTAASHYVVHQKQVAEFMHKQPGKQLMMIDIAVPRDIEPDVREIPGVTVYDVDALQNVVDSNFDKRKRSAMMAETIIEEDTQEYVKWLKTQFVIPAISELKHRGEQIKQKELRRAYNRLGELSDHEKKVVSSLANSIVNQLLHDPVTRLKSYAVTDKGSVYTEALEKLFNLHTGENEDNEENQSSTANAAAKAK
ncbi:MAG: glutamyl-tRNA reductase [Firmicutes bacterium]|nr:glutamyl-tRNA reductase [Bacillota bacterium]